MNASLRIETRPAIREPYEEDILIYDASGFVACVSTLTINFFEDRYYVGLQTVRSHIPPGTLRAMRRLFRAMPQTYIAQCDPADERAVHFLRFFGFRFTGPVFGAHQYQRSL